MRQPLLARITKLVVTSSVALAAGIAGCAAIAGINDGAEKRSVATLDASTPGNDANVSVIEGGITAKELAEEIAPIALHSPSHPAGPLNG